VELDFERKAERMLKKEDIIYWKVIK